MDWKAKFRSLLSEYRDNEKGSFAVTMAVSATALFLSIGAAVDIGLYQKNVQKAQLVADNAALTAAVFVKNHEREPKNSDEGFVDGVTYSSSAAGVTFSENTRGVSGDGVDGVAFNVNYNDAEKEAEVTVSGTYNTIFMGIFGFDQLKFRSIASVKYFEQNLLDPASVLLVLDNSGSMNYADKPGEAVNNVFFKNPAGTVRRITGLRLAVNTFMDRLNQIVGVQNDQTGYSLRTGAFGYNGNSSPVVTLNMDWRILSASQVNQFQASGGTNSAPPLDKAVTVMGNEDNIHKSRHGDGNPLKFVIFMTDGVNTTVTGPPVWTEASGTGLWRGEQCVRINNGAPTCNFIFLNVDDQPSNRSGSFKDFFGRFISFTQQDWVEGFEQSNADVTSLASCEALKADGVQVFTIGFALDEGDYDRDPNSLFFSVNEASRQSPLLRVQANTLLKGCASSSEHFLEVSDTGALEAAFDQIGRRIVAEVIRISS